MLRVELRSLIEGMQAELEHIANLAGTRGDADGVITCAWCRGQLDLLHWLVDEEVSSWWTVLILSRPIRRTMRAVRGVLTKIERGKS